MYDEQESKLSLRFVAFCFFRWIGSHFEIQPLPETVEKDIEVTIKKRRIWNPEIEPWTSKKD